MVLSCLLWNHAGPYTPSTGNQHLKGRTSQHRVQAQRPACLSDPELQWFPDEDMHNGADLTYWQTHQVLKGL